MSKKVAQEKLCKNEAGESDGPSSSILAAGASPPPPQWFFRKQIRQVKATSPPNTP